MKTFICSMCGSIGKCRPEEAELKEEFGDVDKSDCVQVCDTCCEKIRPGNNKCRKPLDKE